MLKGERKQPCCTSNKVVYQQDECHECMTMEKSKKHEPEMSLHIADPTLDTHPIAGAGRTVSELLGDSGNCRHINNQEQSLHLLSLFSEQQRLRHVLAWAESFLSSKSEVHQEFCSADSLILAYEEKRKTQERSPVCKHSSAAKYHHLMSCTSGGNEVFAGGASPEPPNYDISESNNHICACKLPLLDDPCLPFSFILGSDDVSWPAYRETPENRKRQELQDATNKQIPSQDGTCRTSRLISNERQPTYTNQTAASIKVSTSCRSNACHKESMLFECVSCLNTAGAQSERDISEHQMELIKVKPEENVGTKMESLRMGERKGKLNEHQETSTAFLAYAKNYMSNHEPEVIHEETEKTSNFTFSRQLNIPPTLTVYEQYQLCVDRLHNLRSRHSQQIELGCLVESPANERKASEEMAAPVEAPARPTSTIESNSSSIDPEIEKLNKNVTFAAITKKRSSGEANLKNKNQVRSKFNRSRAMLSENEQAKHSDSLTVKEASLCAEIRPVCQRNIVTSNAHLDPHKKCVEFIKGTAEGLTSTDKLRALPGDNVPTVKEAAALTSNPGLFPKRLGCNPDVKGRQSCVKGQKKKADGRVASLRLCEKTHVSLSSLTKKEILQRPQQSGAIKQTKRSTPEDKVKPSSACRDTHKCLQPTETLTHLHDDPGSTSPASGTCRCEQADCKYSPAGGRWLCLPDEVWLSILSLLPHCDLCRVLQVCSRLYTLASDHTLWRNVRLENCTLTEQWFLCVGRRRPRSLRLHSCTGLSLTSCGLEMFFTLCRKTLEELKVTSCTGPGLQGDQMLPLIGQLCDHVTSVDVSWSGATDTGVRALSDCCLGLRLKSVVLNGCHVTDDPLIKLVMRHKESLCRLEVFGCQFLTPSCLQTVYEMCPGLQRLNIGQVPKVTTHSLTVITSQLHSLFSLNLTGLQAVTDASVDALVQNCIKLQSLTFSSCPGVTDRTLHSISKYTPCIRSLDVSGCRAVTDAGVHSLVLGCRRLQQLDLSSTGTGNRGVTLLANYCSGHLRTVKLSFCHITPENILRLCRRCKRLKMLHLYGCAHLPTEREIRQVNTAVKVYPLS